MDILRVIDGGDGQVIQSAAAKDAVVRRQWFGHFLHLLNTLSQNEVSEILI